ncbi:MAG: hypothetical protein M1837_007417 [Sclerophora amabilis]|nr:MAG: hypothetical protein M1837_007417 [Sclerophora amabilis]
MTDGYGNDERNLIDYARHYGVAQDHRCINPLHFDHLPPFSAVELEEPREAFHLHRTCAFTAGERLTVGKDAATLLSTALQSPPRQTSDELLAISASFKRIKDAKIELPLLKTDHESDVRQFGRRVQPDLAELSLLSEGVDEDGIEGLGWTKSAYELPRRFDDELRAEKLLLSKATLLFLQDSLKEASNAEDDGDVSREALGYKKNKALEPCTPPISPLMAPVTPFVPSSPIEHMKPLSGRSSPMPAEYDKVNTLMMGRDCITLQGTVSIEDEKEANHVAPNPDSPSLGDVHSPLKFLEQPSSSPVAHLSHAYEKKVESPLTPPETWQSPSRTSKAVIVREAIRNLIPDMYVPEQAESDDLAEEKRLEDFLASTVAPLANQANRALEQEQLQEADSTKRVTVPIMDFSLPKPPWESGLKIQTLQSKDLPNPAKTELEQIQSIKLEHPSSLVWPGNNRFDAHLTWTPFPSRLGKVATVETIGDEHNLTTYLVSLALEEQIDSDALVWKPEGLRLLDEINDDDDDELEPTSSEQEAEGWKSAVKKRRFDVDDMFDNEAGRTMEITGSRLEEYARRASKVHKFKDAGKYSSLRNDVPYPWDKDEHLLVDGPLVTGNALSHFMKTRAQAPKRKKTNKQEISASSMPEPKLGWGTKLSEQPERPKQSSETASHAYAPLPIPETAQPKTSRSFVASSTLLSQRYLMRCLRQLYPRAIFIERDFTNFTASFHDQPKSIAGPLSLPARPPPDASGDEADLIVSPGVGVIWTTLQKIKQRPLPGQVARSAVRERICRVQTRYEKLIVLICEGRRQVTSGVHDSQQLYPQQLQHGASTSTTVDEKDCQALGDLRGSVTGLGGAEILVTYVGGGEEELARGIVRLMVEYGVDSKSLHLLEDETRCELFLRQAGLNAFAAQAVLSELSPHRGNNADSFDRNDSPHGNDSALVAFVEMSVHERLSRFERLFGGRRLLLEVSRVLERATTLDGFRLPWSRS